FPTPPPNTIREDPVWAPLTSSKLSRQLESQEDFKFMELSDVGRSPKVKQKEKSAGLFAFLIVSIVFWVFAFVLTPFYAYKNPATISNDADQTSREKATGATKDTTVDKA
ncbi:hypothetical protein PFISCL1PPCAC_18164, partial [Pristionchus fissidentatus]